MIYVAKKFALKLNKAAVWFYLATELNETKIFIPNCSELISGTSMKQVKDSAVETEGLLVVIYMIIQIENGKYTPNLRTYHKYQICSVLNENFLQTLL